MITLEEWTRTLYPSGHYKTFQKDEKYIIELSDTRLIEMDLEVLGRIREKFPFVISYGEMMFNENEKLWSEYVFEDKNRQYNFVIDQQSTDSSGIFVDLKILKKAKYSSFGEKFYAPLFGDRRFSSEKVFEFLKEITHQEIENHPRRLEFLFKKRVVISPQDWLEKKITNKRRG